MLIQLPSRQSQSRGPRERAGRVRGVLMQHPWGFKVFFALSLPGKNPHGIGGRGRRPWRVIVQGTSVHKSCSLVFPGCNARCWSNGPMTVACGSCCRLRKTSCSCAPGRLPDRQRSRSPTHRTSTYSKSPNFSSCWRPASCPMLRWRRCPEVARSFSASLRCLRILENIPTAEEASALKVCQPVRTNYRRFRMKSAILKIVFLTSLAVVGLNISTNASADDTRKPSCSCTDKTCKCTN